MATGPQLETSVYIFAHCRETFDVRTKSDPSNVAYTTAKLGMHTDLAYENYVPGVSFGPCMLVHTSIILHGSDLMAHSIHLLAQCELY